MQRFFTPLNTSERFNLNIYYILIEGLREQNMNNTKTIELRVAYSRIE